MSNRDDVIRASEIGEYTYCARAWWLRRVKGQRSANVAALARGQAHHRHHGRQVEAYHLWRRLATIFLLLAAALFLALLVLALRGGT